jgi:hypothetical protein
MDGEWLLVLNSLIPKAVNDDEVIDSIETLFTYIITFRVDAGKNIRGDVIHDC